MHLAANISTTATPRCQDALFFFVMKRRCHESLTREERCVHPCDVAGTNILKDRVLTASAGTDC